MKKKEYNASPRFDSIKESEDVMKVNEITVKAIEKTIFNIKNTSQISMENIIDTFSFEIIKALINDIKS